MNHIQLLIHALNEYIDKIEECELNPGCRVVHKYHLDKIKQYHIMTCEMVSILKMKEKKCIELMIKRNFIDADRCAMKNDLVIEHIKKLFK